VAANSTDTLNPGLFFGKGFGDAPASLSWLHPLARLLLAMAPDARSTRYRGFC
jgi:hypothetical protein